MNRISSCFVLRRVLAPFNRRDDLTVNAEVGIFVTPRVGTTEPPGGGAKTTRRGWGDTTLRTNTIAFAPELVPEAEGYLVLTSSAGDGTRVAPFNGGLTRRLDANLPIDCGVNPGGSRTAPDLTVLAGVSRRF